MVPKTIDDPSAATTSVRRRPRLDHDDTKTSAGDLHARDQLQRVLATWQALAVELKPLAPMLRPELRALIEAMDATCGPSSVAAELASSSPGVPQGKRTAPATTDRA